MPRGLLAALLALGCGGGAGQQVRDDQLTLRTAGGTHQMTLTDSGRVIGPRINLAPSAEGYAGTFDSQLVNLRARGPRIQGTIHSQLVDLHLTGSPDGVLARGLFGGRLGRIEAGPLRIRSWLGH